MGSWNCHVIPYGVPTGYANYLTAWISLTLTLSLSLSISPYHLLLLASLLNYTLCPHRANVNKFLLVSQHWHVHDAFILIKFMKIYSSSWNIHNLLLYTYHLYDIILRESPWYKGKSAGLWPQSKWVQTPVRLLWSLLANTHGKGIEPPYLSSCGLNSITAALQQG